MKTISIRDLRQRWPQAEAALQVEDEILITRDSKPVAKLVRIVAEDRKRKRWDRAAHLRWLKKIWGGKMMPCSDSAIGHARADRWDKESA